MNESVVNVVNEVKKSIFGKDEVLYKIMAAILSGGNILMEDKPGCGKTTIALSFSKVLGLDYKRVQFTSDVMPSDIIGYDMYDRNTNKMNFVKGPVFSNLLLADEINRTSSKTQSALLQAMEEHKVTVNGKECRLEEPFVVIATQNPYGNAGTNLLPQAQMDRFMIALSVGYPDMKSEVDILRSRNEINPNELLKTVINKEDLIKLREKVNNVYVDESIYEYAVNLANATRNNNAVIEIGCSPRGTLALMRMAKSWAFIYGRDYVIPDDICDVFIDVLTHRIVLKKRDLYCLSDSRTEILKNILSSTAKPSVRKRK